MKVALLIRWIFIYLFVLVIISPLQLFSQPDNDVDTMVNAKIKPSIFKKCIPWIAPGMLITTGAIVALNKDLDGEFLNNYEIREERNEQFINFSSKLDNYLQFAPAGAVFLLEGFGVKPKNNLTNQIVLLAKTELLMTTLVLSLKKTVGEKRPDSGKKNSFPSGHTAQAFAAASFFSHEFGHRSVWYSLAAYTVASSVGVMRVLNDRHWVSDIIAGAGFGLLSTNLVYATHQYKWGKKGKTNAMLLPSFENGMGGIALNINF